MLRRLFISLLTPALLLLFFVPSHAAETAASTALEQSMSDTLDLWREGRYEHLFEQLSKRGKTSKEQFVKKMRDTTVRPACCYQKLQDFKVLGERRTEATVYAKIGLEGTSNPSASCTREFRLSHEEGVWKMQLGDIYSLAGATGKKKQVRHRKH